MTKSDASMPIVHEGGCLCGDIRYRTTAAEPIRVTVCHCTFCQKLTGSAFLVEPIFRRKDVIFSGNAVSTSGNYAWCHELTFSELPPNRRSRPKAAIEP